MSIMRSLAIGLSMMIGISAHAAGVPDDCTQMILNRADVELDAWGAAII